MYVLLPKDENVVFKYSVKLPGDIYQQQRGILIGDFVIGVDFVCAAILTRKHKQTNVDFENPLFFCNLI